MKQKTKERFKNFKSKLIKALPVVVPITFTGTMALAASSGGGTGGTGGGGDMETFSSISSILEGWAKGSLGQALTLATLLVGGGYAVASQNVKAAITAGGLSLVLAYGPTVVTSIFTAVF